MDEKSKGVGKTRKFLWGFRFWVWFFLLSVALGVLGAFLSVSGSSDVQDFEASHMLRRALVSAAVFAGILFFAVLLSIPRFIRRFVRWLFSWRMIRRYSIGWNQTDDGGVRGGKSFGPNGPFVPDLEQGDWVWTLAAR